MQEYDIAQVIDLNEEINTLKERLEEIKKELSIEEAVREAFSKDITPKILNRRTRYKRVNGKKQPFTEVVIDEAELSDLLKAVKSSARVEENIKKLQQLAIKLKQEVLQTEIHKKNVELEATIKEMELENRLLEANVKTCEREIDKLLQERELEFDDVLIEQLPYFDDIERD